MSIVSRYNDAIKGRKQKEQERVLLSKGDIDEFRALSSGTVQDYLAILKHHLDGNRQNSSGV